MDSCGLTDDCETCCGQATSNTGRNDDLQVRRSTNNSSIQEVVSVDAVSTAPSEGSPETATGQGEVMHPSPEDALVQVDIDGPRDVKNPGMASNASLPMCQWTVCEDGHYQTFDPEDLTLRRSARCLGRTQVSECNRQACTAGVVPWPTSGSFQQTLRIERMRTCGSAARCSRWSGWVKIFTDRVETTTCVRCRTMA